MAAPDQQFAMHHPRQRRSRVKRIAKQVERVSRVVLVWITLFGAVYGAGYVLMHGSLFAVEQVVIRGELEHLSELEVRQLAGVDAGDNLFALSMDEIQARVQEHPWVHTVAVRRKLPHSVWIFVEERQPMALLNVKGLYLVDVQGQIFKARDNNDPADLPIFSGVTDVAVDQAGVGHSAQIEDLLAVYRDFVTHPVADYLGCSEVTRDAYGKISLITEQPAMRVRLGDAQLRDQWDRLLAVVSTLDDDAKMPRSIDLYIDRKAVVRFDAPRDASET